MDIEKSYQSILAGLEAGSRSLVRLNADEAEQLQNDFETALQNKDFNRLEKILCIVDHAATSWPVFEATILKALGMDLSDRLLVFALNCSRKHIIMERFKKGVRLQYDFLEILKKLLNHPSAEVVEWTLRTIEECGTQGVYFLPEFGKIKPPPWKWFNQHQRAVREIITMLERRWSRFENQ